MRYLRVALLIVGAAALAILVAENDPAAIVGSIAQLSWRFAIVVSFHTFVAVSDALGWRFAFANDRIAFSRLMAVRLAGEAVNMTTPTASVGGEAVKAWLLSDRAPVEETLPSVFVAKTTITVAQGLFLLVGVAVAAGLLPSGSPLFRGMAWLLIAEVVALSTFVVAQMRGLLGGLGRLVGRIGLPPSVAPHHVLLRASDVLERFYREQPRRLLLSTWFHLVGWMLGVAETFLILHFLGVEVSVRTATVIEALATGIRFVAFFIPAGLGALEGGLLVAFAALGLSPTVALSFSLVRRLREAAWVGLGLVSLAVIRPTRGLAAERSAPR
jgi:uncharacterized membrane protein YbhN (UPF0104 family)